LILYLNYSVIKEYVKLELTALCETSRLCETFQLLPLNEMEAADQQAGQKWMRKAETIAGRWRFSSKKSRWRRQVSHFLK